MSRADDVDTLLTPWNIVVALDGQYRGDRAG